MSRPTHRPRAQDCVAALLATLGALWPYLPEFAGRTAYVRDTYRFFAPAKHHLFEAFRQGGLPEWFPYDGLGTPFVGQPMFSLFHPTSLAYLVLPFWTAFALQDAAGAVLAATGAFVLARALGQGRVPAFVASLLYASNGYVVLLTEHQFMKLAAGTLPWYAALVVLAVRRGRGWLVTPAVAMGLLLLAGDVQLALLAAFAGLLVALLLPGPRVRRLALAVASPVAGALLAAVQLVPSLLLVPETERAHALAEANRWAFALDDLAGMLAPVRTPGYLAASYVGIPLLALALTGLCTVRRRRTAVGAAFLVVGLWLSLGDAWGLNALARHVVPLWGQLRYPIKSLPLAMLGLGLLAGEGLRVLHASRRNLPLFAAIAAFALLAGLKWLLVAGTGPATLLLDAIVLVTALLVRVRARERREVLGVVAVVPLALASFAVAGIIWPTIDRSFWDPPPLAVAAKAQGVGLGGPAIERVAVFRNVPMAEEPAVLRPSVAGDSLAYGEFFDLPMLTFYAPGVSWHVRQVFSRAVPPAAMARLFGVFGAEYLVEEGDAAAARKEEIVAREPEQGLALVRQSSALPRAYAVQRARAVPDASAARDAMIDGPFAAGREVLVEAPSVPEMWSRRPENAVIPIPIASRGETFVRLHATLPAPSFVVLNEAWSPGWRAFVDGREAPLLIANGCVRAVETPEGSHDVEFRYTTPGLRLGGWISLISWLIALSLVPLAARYATPKRS